MSLVKVSEGSLAQYRFSTRMAEFRVRGGEVESTGSRGADVFLSQIERGAPRSLDDCMGG